MKKIISFVLILTFIISSLVIVISAQRYALGDANLDGRVDYMDYIVVKRQCMGTLKISSEALAYADVDGSGNIDYMDYMMLKRHCMGTYVIEDTLGGESSEPEESTPEESKPEESNPEIVAPEDCNHPEKELRGAVEPTSAKDGYFGDLYCTKCNTKLFTGSAYTSSTSIYRYDLPDGSELKLPSTVDVSAYTMALVANGAKSKHSTIEEEILRLVNIEREKAGVAPLRLDTNGWRFAYIRAQECVGTFSHTRPDGRGWATVYSDANVRISGTWGENIVMMGTSGSYTDEYVATNFMKLWMNSEGHRANILNPNYDFITIGVEVQWVQEDGMMYYTGVQNFFGDFN